jgi:hypothetical protein
VQQFSDLSDELGPAINDDDRQGDQGQDNDRNNAPPVASNATT